MSTPLLYSTFAHVLVGGNSILVYNINGAEHYHRIVVSHCYLI